MKKWQFVAVILMVIIMATAGNSYAETPKAFKAKWRVAFHSMIHKGNWFGNIMEKWAKEIEDRTGGALKMEFFWPGVLPYKGTEILPVIKDRLVDAAECSIWLMAGTEPIMDSSLTVFLFESQEETRRAVEKVMVPGFGRVFEKYDAINLMTAATGGATHWFSKKPVTKMKDMEGIKCRVFGKFLMKLIKSWGASPINVPITELYTASQQGLIQAVTTSYNTVYDLKLWEVLNYATEISWSYGGTETFLVNKKAFNELPAEFQKVVREVSDKYCELVWREAFLLDGRMRDEAVKHGMKIVQLEPGERDKLKAVAPSIWKDWLDMNGSEGMVMMKNLEKILGRDLLKQITR